jgi:hypothetical protein
MEPPSNELSGILATAVAQYFLNFPNLGSFSLHTLCALDFLGVKFPEDS